jgi:hypothetical protein
MRDYFYCCVKWLIIVCLLLKCLSSLTSQTLLPFNTLVLQLERISIAQIEITLPLEGKVNQVNLNNPNSKRPTIRPRVVPKLKPRQGFNYISTLSPIECSSRNQLKLVRFLSSFEQLKSLYINENKGKKISKILAKKMLYLRSSSFNKNSSLR